jgi:hypothetical protein
MTLSALRTNQPLHLVSLHVRDQQDETCDFDLLSRHAQFNVLAEPSLLMHSSTDALLDLFTAAQTTEFYPLPPCQVYLRDGTGYIISQETRTLTKLSPLLSPFLWPVGILGGGLVGVLVSR